MLDKHIWITPSSTHLVIRKIKLVSLKITLSIKKHMTHMGQNLGLGQINLLKFEVS